MTTTAARVELARNAAGRLVPISVNGKDQRPYQGVNQDDPQGRKAAPPIHSCAHYPENGDKRVPDLETALRKCGLRNGMVISSHHHLRDGDRVALLALQAAARLGARDLMWFPSASFPSQAAAIEFL
ncbi:MAG TPA: citrate lyase subunit alpha, partial [Terriglobales bacterium]|nr:citrate lyase subunit alpha [Terriglobales bacterium]